MYAISLDKPFVAGKKDWPEMAQYNWRGCQHELILFYNSPSENEVFAINHGEAEFALFFKDNVLFFLYRFGQSIPWSDATYTPWLVPPKEREEPPTEPCMALLPIILVDAKSGLVKALRALTLSTPFTTALHGAIRTQMSGLMMTSQMVIHIRDEVYRKYPRTPDMLGDCIARCIGGQR